MCQRLFIFRESIFFFIFFLFFKLESNVGLHHKYQFFFREFQPMASTPDNSSLSSDQDTN